MEIRMDRFKLKQSVDFILCSSKTIIKQLISKLIVTVVFSDKLDSIEPSISEAEVIKKYRITIFNLERLSVKENKTKN